MGSNLLLMMDRKSYMTFHLAPFPLTCSDLQMPNQGHVFYVDSNLETQTDRVKFTIFCMTEDSNYVM